MSTNPVVSAGDVSIARLHGHACWDCGAVEADLAPAGEATVVGFGQAWPIVKCRSACTPSVEESA